MYIDGGNKTTSVSTIVFDYQPAEMNVGRYNYGANNYFKGNVDDIRIYNRVLSAGEIAALAAGNEPQTSVKSVTLGGTLTVSNDLTINGTLDVSGSNYGVTVAGNWYNYGGVFITQEGTVTLNGTGAQSVLSNAATFKNLSITNTTVGGVSFIDAVTATNITASPAATLKFFPSASVTHTITGTFGVSGTSGNVTKLRSITDDSQWIIAFPDTVILTYDDIKDSKVAPASKKAFCLKVRGCVDSGNNTKWSFRRGI
jgi:hypothetical protein